MHRRLFLAALFSLLLLLLTGGAWLRSYIARDHIGCAYLSPSDTAHYFSFNLSTGYVEFAYVRETGRNETDSDDFNTLTPGWHINYFSEKDFTWLDWPHPTYFRFKWANNNSQGAEPNFLDLTWGAEIRLWIIVLLCLPVPLLWLRSLLRSRRHTQQDCCPRCGYDLRATPERDLAHLLPKCPECGAKTPLLSPRV
ncbi:MAG TPA: hypothetical protein VFE58_03375 [Tepidisphaeraceae bacterium]|jgi:rRNA maturation protein Nop10|nr:hypothetical protein [Tepidisphaeraceae bacterium]